jgi:hypothetical protein
VNCPRLLTAEALDFGRITESVMTGLETFLEAYKAAK